MFPRDATHVIAARRLMMKIALHFILPAVNVFFVFIGFPGPGTYLIGLGLIFYRICRINSSKLLDMGREITQNRLISRYCYFYYVFQAFGDPATPRRGFFFLAKTRPRIFGTCPFWDLSNFMDFGVPRGSLLSTF